jgi:hypothetical protein
MNEDEYMKSFWNHEAKYIKSYWISDESNMIRYIIRDGEKVLQSRRKVTVTFTEGLWRMMDQDFIKEEKKYLWLDVPVVEDV